MPERPVSVLVTDLDNTLFDWLEPWHRAFSAMLDELVRISGLRPEQLLDEIRVVHQKHGTSEYAFLLEELPSLTAGLDRDSVSVKYSPAIEAYRKAREGALRLYPGVKTTLQRLKDDGVLIV